MTYKDAVKEFKSSYRDLFIKRVDYLTGQLAWATYVDGLCKDGQITQRQYDTWATPFPYGKALKPTYKQLEEEVYR